MNFYGFTHYVSRYGYTHENDSFSGTASDDNMWGYNGNDVLKGQGGWDNLYGGAGNDQLVGGSGRDYLSGGSGNDVLISGRGDDDLYGGSGADFFDYSIDYVGVDVAEPLQTPSILNADTIWDFNRYENDFIVMPTNGTNVTYGETVSSYTANNEYANFEAAKAKATNYLNVGKDYVFVTNGHDGYLFADRNNDNKFDVGIVLKGLDSLNDFNAVDIDNGDMIGWFSPFG